MPKPANVNHALFIGAVLGLMLKHRLPVEPITDADGDYQDTILVRTEEMINDPFPALPPNVTITVVVPEPPPDWKLTDWTP